MDTESLVTFLAVAKSGSLRSAKEETPVAKASAASRLRAIEALEMELDVRLFRRNRKGMELTDEGRAAVALVQPLVDHLAQVRSRLYARHRQVTGDITIGEGNSDAFKVIAAAVQRAFKGTEGVRVNSFSGNTSRLVERLASGSLDFAVLPVAITTPRFERIDLPIRTRWGVLVPRNWRIAGRETLHEEDLEDLPLVLPQPVIEGEASNPWVERLRPRLRRIVGLHNLVFRSYDLVRSGYCCCICTERVEFVAASDNIRFLPVEGAPEERFFLGWCPDRPLSPAAALFRDAMREVCAEEALRSDAERGSEAGTHRTDTGGSSTRSASRPTRPARRSPRSVRSGGSAS